MQRNDANMRSEISDEFSWIPPTLCVKSVK